MTAIPTDTYPIHLIVTEGYTQAPTPAAVQPSPAQVTYDAMSLIDLAAAINAKTGVVMERASDRAARQERERREQEEEAARVEAQHDREVREDGVTFGELRSAIEAGDYMTALEEAHNLWSAYLKPCALRAITRRFDLAACPCCDGARFLPSEQGDEPCEVCDGLGLVERATAEGFAEDWADYQHAHA